MDESLNVNLGTKYHNQTNTTVNELPTNAIHEQPRKQLIHTTESNLSDQGIDVSCPPGVINARYVRNLMTPSGMQPVILLTDEDIPLDVMHDYLPGCALPEQGHVWSDKYSSQPVSGDPTISAKPIFSNRTDLYKEPFEFYNSNVLVRLICKPALTQSQSFWVSRSSTVLSFSTGQFLNEIGFNWIPSKTNEIFVLLPWFNNNFVAPTPITADTGKSFGYINVKNISEVVSTTGNEVPLNIEYYFAPHCMYTYVPKPITTPAIFSGSVAIAVAARSFNIGTSVLGLLYCPVTTWFIGGLTDVRWASGTINSFFVKVSDDPVMALSTDNLKVRNDNTSVKVGPGSHSTEVFVSDSTATINVNLTLKWFNIENVPPVFTGNVPFDKASVLSGALQIDNSLCPKEIKKELSLKDFSDFYNLDILPLTAVMNPKIKNIISAVSDGFHLSKFFTHFITDVISQDPDIVSYILYYGSEVVFHTYAKNKSEAKYRGYQRIFDYYTQETCLVPSCDTNLKSTSDYIDMSGHEYEEIICGKEEIFEYKYNPKSSTPAQTYGKMMDHNPRENHHEMFFQELPISASNKYTPFNLTLSLSAVANTFPYVNTREYHRHYLKSRMPIITIRSNKTPFTNVLFRVVQGTYTTYQEVMQMPGSEWDPTVNDLNFQPYWYYQTPSVTDISIPLTIVCLSGQVDVSGMQLLLFFNTSTLEYHHKVDYNPAEPVLTSTTLGSTLRELGMCEKCAISPCQCDALAAGIIGKPKLQPVNLPGGNILDNGVLQGGASETTAERVENENIVSRSPGSLDGLTMETNRTHTSLEAVKTQVEKDFHFVGAISTPINNLLKFIALPIIHSNFGKMEVTTAKRYQWWEGEPTFKITTAASSVLAGICYAAQVPANFDFTTLKAESALRMYSRSQKVFWNESFEMPIKWYNPIPKLLVDYITSEAQLGYLVLVFPTPTGATFAGGDQNIKITIHCDTANIGYSRPSNNYQDYSYPGMKSTVYSSQ